jgi:hypothetical protein
MAGGWDDFMSYLMGGTQLGNFLGVGSPTASTQTPTIVPSGTAPTGVPGPVLGGALPAGGGGGLLGGQPPVNPMSYFQPRQGLLGNSPLSNMLQGAFAGLSNVQPGQKGLGALGAGFAAGSQAVQDRQRQQMATALAGQQYQQGQQAMATGNLQIAEAIRTYNIWNRQLHPGAPDLTYNDVIGDPQKLSMVMSAPPNAGGGQPQAGGQPAAAGGTTAAPIDPTILPPGPQPATITSPTGVSTTPPRQGPIDRLKQAFVNYEGGGDPNAVDNSNPNNPAIGGLLKSTFDGINQQQFGGKLNWASPQDRDKVNTQYLTDLYKQAGGDVNRIAVGYFSGPGNMAPPNSLTPWINPTADDGHGTVVTNYVNSIRKQLMLPPIDVSGYAAQGQGQGGGGQMAAGGQQQGQGASSIQAAMDANFAQTHGMSLDTYRAIAMQTHDPAMFAELDKYNADLIQATEAAKSAGQNYRVAPGGELVSGDGRVIASNPTPTTMTDAAGNTVPALQYPNGIIVPATLGASGSGGTTPAGSGGAGSGGTTGSPPIQKPGIYQTGQAQGWSDRMNTWGASQQNSLAAEQQMNALANALSQTRTGAWTTNKADIASKLESVGLGGLAKTILPNVDPAKVEIALREQFAAVIGQILPSTSKPAQEQLQQAQKSLGDPNLSGEANRKIIGQVIGTLRWDRDAFQAADQALSTQPQNPNNFVINWTKDHPIKGYIDTATGELPKMSGDTTGSTQGQASSQGQGGVTSDEAKQLMAQAATDPLYKGLTELKYDPATKRLYGKDQNGNWIDPKGKAKWDGNKWQPL